jgi:hypothetical protein
MIRFAQRYARAFALDPMDVAARPQSDLADMRRYYLSALADIDAERRG